MWHSAYMATRNIAHPEINRTELARRISVDRSYLTKILNGSRKAPLAIALAIFEETGVRIGDIANADVKDVRAMQRALGAQ